MCFTAATRTGRNGNAHALFRYNPDAPASSRVCKTEAGRMRPVGRMACMGQCGLCSRRDKAGKHRPARYDRLVRPRTPKAGSQKSKAQSRKPKAGDQKPEAGSKSRKPFTVLPEALHSASAIREPAQQGYGQLPNGILLPRAQISRTRTAPPAFRPRLPGTAVLRPIFAERNYGEGKSPERNTK